MPNTYYFIELEESRLGYNKTGVGRQSLLLFHGFGQDYAIFNSLVPTQENRFTMYSIDLFFHGKSEWNKGEMPLSKQHWHELMTVFLRKNNIDKFGLIAYSIGAKFALATLECFPGRVTSMYLVAPDGIRASHWYRLATSTSLVRNLFKSLVGNSMRFGRLAYWAQRLSLVDPEVIRFAMTQMDTEEKRNKVYHSWVVFRELKFRMKTIAELLNSNSIPLWILVGKRDKVITVSQVKPLTNLVKNCQVKILDAGHGGIIRESFKELRNIQS